MAASGPTPASEALARLSDLIRPYRRLAILLSGGVDSSLLAAAAARTLGQENVLAITFASQLTPEEDAEAARQVAALLGVRHLLREFDALALPEVAANAPSRCYACKRHIIRLATEAAQEAGFTALAEGSNADDLEGDRPGLAALREAGVASPLAEAALRKLAVRGMARALGLPVWDRPSSPCLATRFPVGHRLSQAEIALIGRAEGQLRRLGLQLLRLRYQRADEVRLEVGLGEIEAARKLGPAILERLRALGLRLAGPPLPYGQKKTPARP